MSVLKVVTIGDGAMATVCSQIVAGKVGGGVAVTMWGRDAERMGVMERERENKRYLPGVKLAEGLKMEGDEAKAFGGAGLLVCAVPVQFMRGVLGRVAPFVRAGVPVVSVSKGIEVDTLCRPSEIIVQALGARRVAALSGPNIAGEMARKKPATMVAAAPRGADGERFARQLQELFTAPGVRVYRNDDLLGVEVAGALKNVIAIAAGILDGMRAGTNAKAALLTRGLVEITRLGVALGAQAETFMGLAGVGDLMTTCFNPEGRNRSFGERVGKGEKPAEVAGSMVGVVEGMPTCESVVRLARKLGVEMPISEGLHAVLFEGRDPVGQLAELMSRELKAEDEPTEGEKEREGKDFAR